MTPAPRLVVELALTGCGGSGTASTGTKGTGLSPSNAALVDARGPLS